jgi:hypothetical protein
MYNSCLWVEVPSIKLPHPFPIICWLLLLQDLSVEAFVSTYELPRVPVVLTGVTDDWPAQQEWTPWNLLEQYREHRFKVGVQPALLGQRMRCRG